MSESLSYVLAKDVHFTDAALYAKVGDLIVHTPPTKIVAYRNGEILKTFELAKVSIQGLINIKALVAEAASLVTEGEPESLLEKIEDVADEVVEEVKAVFEEVVAKIEGAVEPEAEAAEVEAETVEVKAENEVAEAEAVVSGEETEDVPEAEETPEQQAEEAATGVKPKRVKKAK